jgi:predicted alpha/beta-fold hydrolase
MRIEAVDFFYLSMPDVTTDADGSQDALLVRVAAGGHVGFCPESGGQVYWSEARVIEFLAAN